MTVSATASRATCQVIGGSPRSSSRAYSRRTVEALVAERGQRAGRAAELRDQHARLQFAQALGVAVDHREPHRALVAEGDRQRLLQMRAAGHRRVAMLFARGPRAPPTPPPMSRSTIASAARICSTVRGVHDVLRGRAPVHVAPGLAELCGKLAHQPEDRVADILGLVLQRVAIERDGRARAARSRRRPLAGSRRVRPCATAERDLGLDVAFQQIVVGEHARASRRCRTCP